MAHLLVTLGGGVALMVLGYAVLARLTPIRGKAAALVVGLAVCAAYVPLALVRWPGSDVFAIHFSVYLVTAYVLGFLGGHRERQREVDPDRKWFHWGPAAIVAFFVVFVSADAIFVLLAERGLPEPVARQVMPDGNERGVSSAFPGVVPRDYQEKGARYNEYKAQRERQHERGWQVRKGWVDMPVAGRPAELKVEVRTRGGDALTGATINGLFVRDANSDLDRRFELTETGIGLYTAKLTLPEPGRWRLILTVERNGAVHEETGVTRVEAGDSDG